MYIPPFPLPLITLLLLTLALLLLFSLSVLSIPIPNPAKQSPATTTSARPAKPAPPTTTAAPGPAYYVQTGACVNGVCPMRECCSKYGFCGTRLNYYPQPPPSNCGTGGLCAVEVVLLGAWVLEGNLIHNLAGSEKDAEVGSASEIL